MQVDSRTLFNLVAAFALANYQPPNWQTTILPGIEQNATMLMINRYTLNWMKFFAELVTLGHRDMTYVHKVLNGNYLEKYFTSHTRDWHYWQFLDLYQAIMCRADRPDDLDGSIQFYVDKAIQLQLKCAECPLAEFLATELGTNLVLSRIVSKYGHFIQHLLIRRADTGELIDVAEQQKRLPAVNGFIALEDIQCRENEQL